VVNKKKKIQQEKKQEERQTEREWGPSNKKNTGRERGRTEKLLTKIQK